MNIEVKIIGQETLQENGVNYLRHAITLKGAEQEGHDYYEDNFLSLGLWTREMYEKQWQEGLERIKTHDTSCLITCIQHPEFIPWIEAWILYKESQKIIVRNRIFFGSIYQFEIGYNQITPENCYDFLIKPRIIEKTKPQQWIVQQSTNIEFKIIEREIFKEDGIKYLRNEIVFRGGRKNGEDFYETNNFSIEFWTLEMYEQQWQEGLERLKTHNTSCLVSNIQNPQQMHWIEVWMLYKVDNKVIIRNRIFFGPGYEMEIRDHKITPENCYDFLIDPLNKRDEEKPAEWIVDL